jgi:hypothetical protein
MSTRVWNLENKIDISGLENIHLEICCGIALSTRDLSTRLIPHHEAEGNIKEAIDFKSSEEARISAVKDDVSQFLSSNELKIYDSFNYNQKRVFLEVYKGAYTDGEFVRIKFTKKENLNDKFATFYSSTTELTENAKHFPLLLNWINTLPFSDIGRILIFVTKHHLPGDLHYDRRDDWLDGRHHFIWLNPFGQKKFSIYEGYTEVEVSSKAMFFDTSCIHGSGSNNRTVYTIRVDGQFTKEFCDENNIPWKQR